MKRIMKIKTMQLFGEGEGGEAASAAQTQAETNLPEGAENRYSQWLRQAEDAKKLYPGLDLAQEVKNPRFARMLRMGEDVASAYLITHQHHIIPAAMRYGIRAGEAKVASRVAANSLRPQENGIGAQAAAITRPDVSRMTRADRQAIAKRVAAGERIVF